MKAFAAVLLFSAVSSGSLHAQRKCEAILNGYRIHTVYITGPQFNSVIWGYKHISEATCLTPVTDPAKADAILELVPNGTPERKDDGPLTISCSSDRGSSTCIDSEGNELDVSCDRNGNCSSYYGPSPGVALMHAVGEWIRSAWYQAEARLYTPDHKIIWKTEGFKAKHWTDLWPDRIREATFDVGCKLPTGKGDGDRFRKYAGEKCGIDFDPFIAIDLKANARADRKRASIAESDEMKRNAAEAAAKQEGH